MKTPNIHLLMMCAFAATICAVYGENFVIARKKGMPRVSQDDIAQQAAQLVKDTNELIRATNRLQAQAITLVDQYANTGACTKKNESSAQLHKNIEHLQAVVKQVTTALESCLLTQ